MIRLFRLTLVIFIFFSCSSKEYKKIKGFIFGTIYNISWEINSNSDYSAEIQEIMLKFDSSLSTYNQSSIISGINNNNPDIEPDEYFLFCFNKAMEISKKTGGAFDITIAPLVNAWGFGYTGDKRIDLTTIDSLKDIVGYKKIKLVNNNILKENPGIKLDASAIAKGYAVDIVSEFLEKMAVENYMVEIGGELRVKGKNKEGINWRVGVDKPVADLSEREIYSVINITDISMATSGNYRQFYIEEGVKYSHTIDPFSGYPARNNLLSSTVFTVDCLSADAYATAFMVMGLEKSIKFVENEPELEAYFIYSDEIGNYKTYASKAIKNKILLIE